MGLRALGLVAALGMVLVFAGSTEDAGNTWGALFMRSTFEATPFLAGMAFVALQGAQTIGRFTGDAIVDRLGACTTLWYIGDADRDHDDTQRDGRQGARDQRRPAADRRLEQPQRPPREQPGQRHDAEAGQNADLGRAGPAAPDRGAG